MQRQRWILLAEDNASDADLTLRALGLPEGAGGVVVATDGSEALDCLYRRGAFAARETPNPAGVLLDLKMPKVDGFEVLRQIRAEPELRCIPVVVFTSSSQESDILRSYQLGANAYLVKPVEFQQFAAVLKAFKTFWLDANEAPPASAASPRRSPASLVTAA